MFKETLLIEPKLSQGDLNNMEKSLHGRFKSVAEKFGKGLAGFLGGAGITGVVGGVMAEIAKGLVDRITAPLKETQDAIERTLQKSGDLEVRAKQFGTSSGKLARLDAIGTATGIDSQTLSFLMTRFQTSVAEAAADPTKQSAVRAFVGEKDMAEGFFNFIQGLNKLTESNKLLVEKDVFGEKQVLKVSEFIQNAGSIAGKLGGPSVDALTKQVDKGAGLEKMKQLNDASREISDLFQKNALMTPDMITAMNTAAKLKEKRIDEKIKNFDFMSEINDKVEGISNKLDELVTNSAALILGNKGLKAHAKGIEGSRVIRLPGKKAGDF